MKTIYAKDALAYHRIEIGDRQQRQITEFQKQLRHQQAERKRKPSFAFFLPLTDEPSFYRIKIAGHGARGTKVEEFGYSIEGEWHEIPVRPVVGSTRRSVLFTEDFLSDVILPFRNPDIYKDTNLLFGVLRGEHRTHFARAVIAPAQSERGSSADDVALYQRVGGHGNELSQAQRMVSYLNGLITDCNSFLDGKGEFSAIEERIGSGRSFVTGEGQISSRGSPERR